MKRGIIVAGFGTTYKETGKKCIEPIVNLISENFPDCEVVFAITSRIVKKRIQERDGLFIPNEIEAVEILRSKGVEDIYIQPLHIIPGHEYAKLEKLGFPMGKPLLFNGFNSSELIKALDIREHDGITVLVGHGTDHSADELYSELEMSLNHELNGRYIVGTIEGERDLESVIEALRTHSSIKVLLRPLMLVAGDHAVNDIASDEEGSWKSILSKEGYVVEPDLRGLGEIDMIRREYLNRISELLNTPSGRLFIIGTGPGAEDLLTLRAINAIRESEVIFVPDNKGKNMALDTTRNFIEGKEVVRIELPMKAVTEVDYENAAKLIEEKLDGRCGAYLTIGDAMTYSTAIYILQRLSKDIGIEVVPGIPSYIAAFDRCVMPMTTKGESFLLVDDPENLDRELLKAVDSVAVLKTSSGLAGTIQVLDECGFIYRYVKRVSLPEESVLSGRDEVLNESDYMSLIIAAKNGDGIL